MKFKIARPARPAVPAIPADEETQVLPVAKAKVYTQSSDGGPVVVEKDAETIRRVTEPAPNVRPAPELVADPDKYHTVLGPAPVRGVLQHVLAAYAFRVPRSTVHVPWDVWASLAVIPQNLPEVAARALENKRGGNPDALLIPRNAECTDWLIVLPSV
jgi:hypothetical protein